MSAERRRFIVRGSVQGVNFRWTAVGQAARLGVTGRIWNRPEGAVECVAEGEADALERFREWLGQGPRLARVSAVDEEELSGPPRYSDFDVSRGPVD